MEINLNFGFCAVLVEMVRVDILPARLRYVNVCQNLPTVVVRENVIRLSGWPGWHLFSLMRHHCT